MWFRRNFKTYLNSLNHHQDHPSGEVLASCAWGSLGRIPGEWGHLWRSDVCVACMLVCACICALVKSSRVICLRWQPQALDVDNTGHIDKEILTQIFTEEGEAFSEVVQVLFFILKNERAFQNLFSLGGDARVLQRCPRPGDQVSSLQRVCSLPLRRRQLLNDLSHQSQTVFK